MKRIDTRSAKFALILTGLLIAAGVGYRAYVFDDAAKESPSVGENRLVDEWPQSLARSPDDGVAANEDSGVGFALRTMAEPYRNQILWLSIRDAGYVCNEVVSSEHPANDVDVWFVRCDGAVSFDVTIDDYGRISVAASLLYDSVVPQIRRAQ